MTSGGCGFRAPVCLNSGNGKNKNPEKTAPRAPNSSPPKGSPFEEMKKPLEKDTIKRVFRAKISRIERLSGSLVLGKLTKGASRLNEYGQIVPKAAGWAGRASTAWGLLLQPSELGCSDLDCNRDNIPDYIVRRYNEALSEPEI